MSLRPVPLPTAAWVPQLQPGDAVWLAREWRAARVVFVWEPPELDQTLGRIVLQIPHEGRRSYDSWIHSPQTWPVGPRGEGSNGLPTLLPLGWEPSQILSHGRLEWVEVRGDLSTGGELLNELEAWLLLEHIDPVIWLPHTAGGRTSGGYSAGFFEADAARVVAWVREWLARRDAKCPAEPAERD